MWCITTHLSINAQTGQICSNISSSGTIWHGHLGATASLRGTCLCHLTVSIIGMRHSSLICHLQAAAELPAACWWQVYGW